MNDTLQEKLQLLCQSYLRRLPTRIREFETVWTALEQSNWNSTHLETLHELAHRLAGTGGSYGFNELSKVAHQFEMSLEVPHDTNKIIANFKAFKQVVAELTVGIEEEEED